MSKSVTLSSMITQVREAADMVGSSFATDIEITTLLNAYVAELYDLLVAAYGPAFYASSYTFNTVSGQREYALPTSPSTGCDLYQLLGVDISLGDDEVITATPFDFNSRNRFSSSTSWVRSQPVYYRVHGSYIWLIPAPSGVYSVTIHHIPAAPTLASGGITSFDGINGWERYAIVSAAIALLQKEESDPSVLMAEKASLTRRIQTMSKNRDAAYPDQIVRVRGRQRRVVDA